MARSEMLPGTLDMLVLQTLEAGPLHGYAIVQHIDRVTEGVLRIEHGSLYPALERLQRGGWVVSKWGKSPTGRRARFYRITASGRRRLGTEVASYDAWSLAVARVLGRAEAEGG
jgi:PadR family transcriptional regulator, regulatory protein PadR